MKINKIIKNELYTQNPLIKNNLMRERATILFKSLLTQFY